MRLFHLNSQLFAQKNIIFDCPRLPVPNFFCIPERGLSSILGGFSLSADLPSWVLRKHRGLHRAALCAGIQQQELESLKLNSNSSWWKLGYSGWTTSLKKSWIYLQTPHVPTPWEFKWANPSNFKWCKATLTPKAFSPVNFLLWLFSICVSFHAQLASAAEGGK